MSSREFAFIGEHGVKIKENWKINKYLDLVREQKYCETGGWQWHQL